MHNPFRQFLELLPARPLQVGTVASVLGEVSVVELPGGGSIQARGQATVGMRVWVRDGVIEGEAPALTYVSATV